MHRSLTHWLSRFYIREVKRNPVGVYLNKVVRVPESNCAALNGTIHIQIDCTSIHPSGCSRSMSKPIKGRCGGCDLTADTLGATGDWGGPGARLDLDYITGKPTPNIKEGLLLGHG